MIRYPFYVIDPTDGKITCGAEFREDAKDFVVDNKDWGKLVVATRASLERKDVPIGRAEAWKNLVETPADKKKLRKIKRMIDSVKRNPNNYTVAETILAQLGGAGKLSAMIGAKDFVCDRKSLQFRFAGNREIGNKIVITLEPSDTYKVQLYWIRGLDCKEIAMTDMVYNDQLRGVIEAHTGLHLSLGTMGRNPSSGSKQRKRGTRTFTEPGTVGLHDKYMNLSASARRLVKKMPGELKTAWKELHADRLAVARTLRPKLPKNPADVAGYLADGGVLTDANDKRIGTYKIVSTWKTPISSISGEMHQVEAIIKGVVYTGRSAGVGMLWTGKRKAVK